jgi:hypothetical protein
MEGILGLVMNQLGSGGLEQIGQMLGIGDKKETEKAVGTAVGVLAAGMARNASDESGKQSLDAAIEKDHDGSIFENVTGFLGNVMQGPGAGILGHVLGKEQPQVETAIAEKSGLSLDKVTPLLVTVAPMVMGALGKMKKDKGLDADGVASTLATERTQIEKADNGIDLGSVLGMVGGLTGGGSSDGGGGGGGLLGMLGGLFGGKKKNG